MRMRERIASRLPQMPGAMARVAEFLVAEPAAPLDLSITDVAAHSGTSPATVTRFCRTMGYTGYVQFRVAVAADIGRGDAQSSWRTDVGRAFRADDGPAQVLRTLTLAHTLSLTTTADGINIEQARAVARRIAACRHLDIYGVGGSGMMATEMAGRLYRIGIPVYAWTELHAALASAAVPRDDSAAIAISNTGRTNDTIEALSLARSSGTYTVAITGSAASPLAAIADDHIEAVAPDGYFQPDDLAAKHAQLLVLDLLYILVAQQNFNRAATLLAASAMSVASHRRPVPRRPGVGGRTRGGQSIGADSGPPP